MVSNDNGGPAACLKINMLYCGIEQVQESLPALLIGTQQYYSGMSTRRICSQVSESFVTGEQPSLLALHQLPNNTIA